MSEDGRKQQSKLQELVPIAERLGCTLPQLAVGESQVAEWPQKVCVWGVWGDTAGQMQPGTGLTSHRATISRGGCHVETRTFLV